MVASGLVVRSRIHCDSYRKIYSVFYEDVFYQKRDNPHQFVKFGLL